MVDIQRTAAIINFIYVGEIGEDTTLLCDTPKKMHRIYFNQTIFFWAESKNIDRIQSFFAQECSTGRFFIKILSTDLLTKSIHQKEIARIAKVIFGDILPPELPESIVIGFLRSRISWCYDFFLKINALVFMKDLFVPLIMLENYGTGNYFFDLSTYIENDLVYRVESDTRSGIRGLLPTYSVLRYPGYDQREAQKLNSMLVSNDPIFRKIFREFIPRAKLHPNPYELELPKIDVWILYSPSSRLAHKCQMTLFLKLLQNFSSYKLPAHLEKPLSEITETDMTNPIISAYLETLVTFAYPSQHNEWLRGEYLGGKSVGAYEWVLKSFIILNEWNQPPPQTLDPYFFKIIISSSHVDPLQIAPQRMLVKYAHVLALNQVDPLTDYKTRFCLKGHEVQPSIESFRAFYQQMQSSSSFLNFNRTLLASMIASPVLTLPIYRFASRCYEIILSIIEALEKVADLSSIVQQITSIAEFGFAAYDQNVPPNATTLKEFPLSPENELFWSSYSEINEILQSRKGFESKIICIHKNSSNHGLIFSIELGIMVRVEIINEKIFASYPLRGRISIDDIEFNNQFLFSVGSAKENTYLDLILLQKKMLEYPDLDACWNGLLNFEFFVPESVSFNPPLNHYLKRVYALMKMDPKLAPQYRPFQRYTSVYRPEPPTQLTQIRDLGGFIVSELNIRKVGRGGWKRPSDKGLDAREKDVLQRFIQFKQHRR